MQQQQTQPFWAGRSVFLTGATGFVGKAVLVKLLMGSVGRPAKIFLLLREKDAVPAEDRLRTLLASEVFAAVGSQSNAESLQGLARERLVAVPGDISEEGLGMSPENRARIIASCSIVINCAAEVSFQEPLVDVRLTNTRSAQEVMALARACHERGALHAFVHVSTAYVNSDRVGEVEEKIYPAPFDPREFMEMPDEELAARAGSVIGCFPNTYTFTKNMAEQLLSMSAVPVDASAKPLPMVIVRPAVVGCSLMEPLPGWVDAVLGTGSIILLGGLGVLQHSIGGQTLVHDLAPLDTVVDAILAAPPCIDELQREKDSVPVVQVGSSWRRAVTCGMVIDEINDCFSKYPSRRQARPVQLRLDMDAEGLEKEMLWDERRANLLKAFCCTRQLGRSLAKAVNKTRTLDDVLRYFSTHEWIFQAPNLSRLPALLKERGEPAEAYSALRLEEVDWQSYLNLFCYGINHFVLKGEEVPLPDTAYQVGHVHTCASSGVGPDRNAPLQQVGLVDDLDEIASAIRRSSSSLNVATAFAHRFRRSPSAQSATKVTEDSKLRDLCNEAQGPAC